METIILQLAIEWGQTVLQRALSGEISDLDTFASDLNDGCKKLTLEMLTVILKYVNLEIREDKAGRKEAGLVLHKKDQIRSILTRLGLVEWCRDYYKNVEDGSYCYPLDAMIGVRPYARIGDTVCADLVNMGAELSYARSADIVTGGAVSRQSVRDIFLRLDVPEPTFHGRKSGVRELHVYADEDHAHMQRPGKEKGKRSQIVPMVTVSEGVQAVGVSRSKVAEAMRFADEHFDTKALWRNVAGYICASYDVNDIEKIVVHGDGGQWIRNGLSEFAQTEHQMDKFHFEKRLRALCKAFPERNVRYTLCHALISDDRRRIDQYLRELNETAGNDQKRHLIMDFGTYLMGYWDEIRKTLEEGAMGSCTEALISHGLSERISRNPMGWSKAGLGKVVCTRMSVLNGRRIEAADFKPKEKAESLTDHLDRWMNEFLEEARDWSLFEKVPPIFDGASGTQTMIHALGVDHSILS